MAGPIVTGNQATAVAYAEPEPEPVAERAEAPVFTSPPRPTASTLFTQPAVVAAPEPAPVQRTSLFNIMTKKVRGGRTAAPVEDVPDLRDLRRVEPRAPEVREPSAQVRQTAPEQESVGLDVPAFLRRQHS
jgi:hypothetical protein